EDTTNGERLLPGREEDEQSTYQDTGRCGACARAPGIVVHVRVGTPDRGPGPSHRRVLQVVEFVARLLKLAIERPDRISITARSFFAELPEQRVAPGDQVLQ